MTSASSGRSITSPLADLLSRATPLAVAVLLGVALSLAVAHVSPAILVVIVITLILFVAFLHRPDLGLLILLFVRASTDLSFWIMGGVLADTQSIRAALPNIGIGLILVIGGGAVILRNGYALLGLPGGRLFGLFLLVGLVASLRSENLLVSLAEWTPVLAAFVVYSLAAHLYRSADQVRRVIDIVALSFVTPAIFGFFQLIRGSQFFLPEIGATRVFGTFAHPNAFGIYLVVLLAISAAQLVSSSRTRRLVTLIIAIATVFLLIGTLARVAWVGGLIVLAVVGLFRSRKLLVIAPILLVIMAATTPLIGARLTSPFGGSFADRVDIWQRTYAQWLSETSTTQTAIPTLMSRLVGLGPGAVELVTIEARGAAILAHNDYLRVLIEYGILGLSFHILLIISLVVMAFGVFRRLQGSDASLPALSFLAVTVAVPVMSLTDNIFAQTAIQVYFWALAGLTVRLGKVAVG